MVVGCTGLFTAYEKAKVHIVAGAKRVVISAPAKDDPTPENPGMTVLMGISNDRIAKESASAPISSNASCTTNAGSPLIAILDEAIGIEKALLNTTHSYTATQALIDGQQQIAQASQTGERAGFAAACESQPGHLG